MNCLLKFPTMNCLFEFPKHSRFTKMVNVTIKSLNEDCNRLYSNFRNLQEFFTDLPTTSKDCEVKLTTLLTNIKSLLRHIQSLRKQLEGVIPDQLQEIEVPQGYSTLLRMSFEFIQMCHRVEETPSLLDSWKSLRVAFVTEQLCIVRSQIASFREMFEHNDFVMTTQDLKTLVEMKNLQAELESALACCS